MSEQKKTILYVDDDPDYRDSVRVILESGGYVMLEAESAEEGLAVFRKHGADLIIVDLMMEEVDSGTSFVKDLRAGGSSVPIYMLSSVGESLNDTVDHKQLGLEGVFQKPLEREALLTELASRFGDR
jgi:DNA-binding response OmpR family regulator